MKDSKIHDQASHVANAAGEVMMDGPDGVAVSMTPEAASLTGARLIDNAAEAKGKEALEVDRRERRTKAR
ncbi:hypothetical protein [Sphingomonas abietis]|uniref:Uncharacterized protein n=1 Tax=Sphingomonas abietis TaxID=3012344 RepID=A0ABY7NPH3_9SPHN|nr:hypothetical protein [Sphingomonas abietis]WBO22850.1 hypothetical protein PBT88_01470 [Sphingomonas abietis]